MVEIKHGEYQEVADLAGLSVAEARKKFRDELGIPDNANARINGKKVNHKLETETALCDEDKLTFTKARGGKGTLLVGALLLALAVTGGIFAATATSATATIDATAVSTGIADVTFNAAPNAWYVFPRYKGSMTADTLFTVDPDTGFNGDLLVSLYLTNGDSLVNVYKAMVMKIEIYDDSGGTADSWDGTDALVAGPEYLTLSGSEVSLAYTQSGNTAPYFVRLTSGYYSCFRWVSAPSSSEEDPIIFCEVGQASPSTVTP
ncbi:hypothetical protein ACFLXF_03715 [Chloroflexota bacterium]